jgi:hypothetical protein
VSDALDELHVQQGLAALSANPNLLHVFDGKVDDPTPDPPYVLVYSTVAWPREGVGTSLTEVQCTITTTFTCHCVGLTAAAARIVGMQVRSSLLNLRPTIGGRSCGPIKEDEVSPPTPDESTGRLVMDQVRVYSFVSTG